MLRVQAWERLNDAEYCGQLRMNEFYDLMVRAGYPEELAQETARQRGWERICAGVEA